GSIQSSGLKASGASRRGTCMAIWQARSEASKPSIRPAPLSPAKSRFQVVSTPLASGETMPNPVTTTLRIGSLGLLLSERADVSIKTSTPARMLFRSDRFESELRLLFSSLFVAQIDLARAKTKNFAIILVANLRVA